MASNPIRATRGRRHWRFTRRRSMVGRFSAVVAATLKAAHKALERPELLGLSSNASAAAVFSRLVEIGWDRTLREQREKEQLDVYARYERDRERRLAAPELQRAALRSGVA